jgi:hypothetical protein
VLTYTPSGDIRDCAAGQIGTASSLDEIQNTETWRHIHECQPEHCHFRSDAETLTSVITCKKVKQSLYRPGQALSFPGGWGCQISRQSAHKRGKVVSPTHRPPLSPGNIPGTHFCWRLSRPQGFSAAGRIKSMKIELVTFRLVAQCLNQLRRRVPPSLYVL